MMGEELTVQYTAFAAAAVVVAFAVWVVMVEDIAAVEVYFAAWAVEEAEEDFVAAVVAAAESYLDRKLSIVE